MHSFLSFSSIRVQFGSQSVAMVITFIFFVFRHKIIHSSSAFRMGIRHEYT